MFIVWFSYGRLFLLVGPKGAGQSPAKVETCGPPTHKRSMCLLLVLIHFNHVITHNYAWCQKLHKTVHNHVMDMSL